VKYFNLPFRPNVMDYYRDELKLYQKTLDLGYFYLGRLKHEGFPRQLFTALEIIADPQYHPVLFHCGAGKDRTGVLAAMVLDLLGVADADIIEDYAYTDTSMAEIRSRIVNNPVTTEEVKSLPDFHWRAAADYMVTFLDGLRKEYGGTAGYLQKHGADKTLAKRVAKALVG
jgi:protein-tyrosine phosphatase